MFISHSSGSWEVQYQHASSFSYLVTDALYFQDGVLSLHYLEGMKTSTWWKAEGQANRTVKPLL
jgi:hypothetical protein